MSRRFGFCVALVLTCLIRLPHLLAQEASDSVRFNQPIPVTIRMSNNAIIKTMLVGIDQDGISTVSPQGRAVEYLFPKIRTVRSQDGSLFITPAKDDMAEVITRLSALNPAPASPNAAGPGVPGGAAMPGFGHGQPMPSQPGFNNGMSGAQMMAHAQAPSQPTYNPPPDMASTAHASMPPQFNNYSPPPSGMPHSQMSQPPQMSMPGMGPHQQMNSNMGPPNMSQQMVMQYECTKCHYKFTSTTEVKAGHRCTNCGIIWGEIQDQSGRTISSSPAAKIGGGFGFLAVVIGIIVAIVRKVQSA